MRNVRASKVGLIRRENVCGHGGFTLLEMVCVMGIIIIMSSLAGLAFNHLGQANSITTGGNQIADLVNLARQNSLSKNCTTALVLLTDVEPDRTRQAFTLLQFVPPAGSATLQNSHWTQITTWQPTATGTCVDISLSPSYVDACTFQDASSQDSTSPVSLPASFSFEGHTVSTYKFVVFLSGGNLLNGVSVQVELVEGYLQAGPANTAKPVAVYTHALSGTSNPALPADFYRVTILAATGRIKIDRIRNSSPS